MGRKCRVASSVEGDVVHELTGEIGRIKINIKAITVGQDLCIIISGGDSPHIGCVTLSIPRLSLADTGRTSATTSVLNLVGHKDDHAASYVSNVLAAKLNKNVVVTGGIHVDKITPEEIRLTMELLKRLTDNLIEKLS
jgi:hypothetical protein